MAVINGLTLVIVLWIPLSFVLGVIVGKMIRVGQEYPVSNVRGIDDAIMRARGFESFTLRCGHKRWVNPEHFEPDDMRRMLGDVCSYCQYREGDTP